MENINESRNSISTYIQSFTQHMLLKKYTGILHDYSCNEIELVKMSQKREQLKRKTLTFEHKNNCLQRIKKRNIKSRSLSALNAVNAHPVNLILSVSQLVA